MRTGLEAGGAGDGTGKAQREQRRAGDNARDSGFEPGGKGYGAMWARLETGRAGHRTALGRNEASGGGDRAVTGRYRRVVNGNTTGINFSHRRSDAAGYEICGDYRPKGARVDV